MAEKEFFYVHRDDDGNVTRLAKQSDGLFYGWENGEWIEMPTLNKIMFDASADYDDISKDEAEKLMLI